MQYPNHTKLKYSFTKQWLAGKSSLALATTNCHLILNFPWL